MIEFQENAGERIVYQQLTLNKLIQNIPSLITFDVAPQHTGIVYWNGTQFKEYHFKLNEPDKQNPHWLYLLRKEFKGILTDIVRNKEFEYCLIEDVYGGENYDTVIQLLILNSVIDELIDEGICKVNHFYRMIATSWMAKARLLYKQEGKLKSKFETQGLLEYLQCDYYLQHKDLSPIQKKDICFEDTCDAYGMVVALIAMIKLTDIKVTKVKKINFTDIKMIYVEHLEDCVKSRDKRFKSEEKYKVELRKNIKDSILDIVRNDNGNKVFYAELPISSLGAFGMKYNFTFYASGQGFLVFYVKQKKK